MSATCVPGGLPGPASASPPAGRGTGVARRVGDSEAADGPFAVWLALAFAPSEPSPTVRNEAVPGTITATPGTATADARETRPAAPSPSVPAGVSPQEPTTARPAWPAMADAGPAMDGPPGGHDATPPHEAGPRPADAPEAAPTHATGASAPARVPHAPAITWRRATASAAPYAAAEPVAPRAWRHAEVPSPATVPGPLVTANAGLVATRGTADPAPTVTGTPAPDTVASTSGAGQVPTTATGGDGSPGDGAAQHPDHGDDGLSPEVLDTDEPTAAEAALAHWDGERQQARLSIGAGEDTVDVQLRLAGERATVEVRTDDTQTRERLLDDGGQALAERLAREGLTLADLSLGSRQPSGERDRPGRTIATVDLARGRTPVTSEGVEPAPRPAAGGHNRALDLFV